MKFKILKSLSLLAVLGMFGLSSCGEKADYTIGVCQLVQHEALDSATNGFTSKLTELFKEINKTVSFDVQNAAGETSTCSVIINSFLSKNVNLIMANATPAVQTAANATDTVPIIGTSVTEYGVALGIPDFPGYTNRNVSGTSDLASLEDQVNSMLELVPTVSKVGIIYCTSEANSLYQVNEVSKILKNKSITPTSYGFTDANDISNVCTKAANENDLIYVPTDNTAASCASIIGSICENKNKPVFCGEEGMCKKCGFATLSISYTRLGEITAQMAFNVLTGAKDIKTYEIQYDISPVKKYDALRCQALGINIPENKGWEALVR